MAIKITSGNIYEKQNTKIVDNLINKVEIKQNIVSPSNSFVVVVSNQKIDTEKFEPITSDAKNQSVYGETSDNNKYKQIATALIVVDTYIKVNSSISKELKNKYISKVYSGKKTDNENYINVSKQVENSAQIYTSPNSYLYKEDFTNISEFVFDAIINNKTNIDNLGIKNSSNFDKKKVTFNSSISNSQMNYYEFPPTWEYTIKDNNTQYFVENDFITFTSSNTETAQHSQVHIDDLENQETDLSEVIITNNFENDSFDVSEITILVKRETYYCATSLLFDRPTDDKLNKTYPSKVIKSTQVAKDLSITFYGDTIGIDLSEINSEFIAENSSGDKPFSLQGNELLQDNTMTFGEPTVQYLANNVLEQYKNGKETATLLCDYGEYYDEQGRLVVSAKQIQADYFVFDFSKPIDFELDYEAQDLDWQKVYIFNSNGHFEIGDLVYFNGEKAEIVYSESYGSKAVKFIKGGLFDGAVGSTIKVYKARNPIYFGYTDPDEFGVISHYVYIDKPFLADINIICKDNYGGAFKEHKFTIKKGETKSEEVADTPIEIVSATYKVPMSIPIGAEVIPYVYTIGRIDKPMSLINGEKKVFEVVAKKPFYDGISWQELTLLEKTEPK